MAIVGDVERCGRCRRAREACEGDFGFDAELGLCLPCLDERCRGCGAMHGIGSVPASWVPKDWTNAEEKRREDHIPLCARCEMAECAEPEDNHESLGCPSRG